MARTMWSFDSVVLAAVAVDLETMAGAPVTRIVQPDRDDIVLVFSGHRSVLFSIHPRWARVHLVDAAESVSAGSFCKLLRARLGGARLRQILQPLFERVLTLRFEALAGEVDLTAEVMGRRSNLLLISAGKIIGALKTVTPTMSSVREVQPGKAYAPPPRERMAPQELTEAVLRDLLASADRPIARRLTEAILGISPLLADELVIRAGVTPTDPAWPPAQAAAALWPVLTALTDTVRSRRFQPVLYRADGAPVAFTAFPFEHLTALTAERTATMSAAVAAVAAAPAVDSRLGDDQHALVAVLRAAIDKGAHAEADLQASQAEAERAAALQQQGDLLFAYASQIPPGSTEATLPGFDGAPVTIQLDPTLSAADNARRLFARLARVKSAQPEIARRLRDIGEQRTYLENALALVETATSADDLRALRAELVDDGVLPPKRTATTPRSPSAGPRRFATSSGHEIVVGRTNRENDEVTFTVGRPSDVWFHARGMPGAHVILRSRGTDVPKKTLEEAAQIAAYYSRGRTAGTVPVSYTLRKYVRKPPGAKPGLVIISKEKTIVVEPKLPAG